MFQTDGTRYLDFLFPVSEPMNWVIAVSLSLSDGPAVFLLPSMALLAASIAATVLDKSYHEETTSHQQPFCG